MTPEQEKAARITAAAERAKLLPALIDKLDCFRRCDMDHARTNREDDYLAYLEAQHDVAKLLEQIMQFNLCDQIEQIEDDARSECNYSISEGAYYNDQGDLVDDGSKPRDIGYADYRSQQIRDEGGAV